MSHKRLTEELNHCIQAKSLVKLTLSKQREAGDALKQVFVKPVELKAGLHWSFVYRYSNKDVTKNYRPSEAITEIFRLLQNTFFNADLILANQTYYFHQFPNGKTNWSSVNTPKRTVVLTHNKQKQTSIDSKNNLYLQELGVVTHDGKVKKDLYHKFRQINRYIELVSPLINELPADVPLSIADMGSGKGYLTFALYDYLVNHLQKKVNMLGVELRKELVDKCNSLAQRCGFTGLRFECGNIESIHDHRANILIALHACDVATDMAIAAGIRGGCEVIVCSPCCHKQLRKQLKPAEPISALTQHGIIEERLAEILTDTIRSLYLEAYGYSTKIMEFVSTEHTPKNLLLTGVKKHRADLTGEKMFMQIDILKKHFGIQEHALDSLLPTPPIT